MSCLTTYQVQHSKIIFIYPRARYYLYKSQNELVLELSLSSSPFVFTPGSCNDLDLGIGSGSIPDDKITASSVQSARTPAKNGRLGYTAGSSWCAEASDPSPYLQIDLQTPHVICAVSTQGNSQEDEWVETYTLQSSTDGSNWSDFYDESGQVKVKYKLVYLDKCSGLKKFHMGSVDSTLSYLKVDRVFLSTSSSLKNESTHRSVLDVPTSDDTFP